MYPPESHFFLRRLLALRPARLRWVVIELMNVRFHADPDGRSSRRAVYWHDWYHTRLAWQQIWTDPHMEGERWALAIQHGGHLLKAWTHLGRGAEILQRTLEHRSAKSEPPLKWEAAEGYEPDNDNLLSGRKLADYLARVDAVREGLPPQPLAPVLDEAVRSLAADVLRAGAEPIFVITPTLNERENFAALPGNTPLFAFNNPARFPTLFDPANHSDPYHLNERGAVEFTRLLAERFVTHLRETENTDGGSAQRVPPR
jgi:hypothetical protein